MKVYDKYILTLNKHGVTSKEPNEVTEAFINFAFKDKALLEIGTAHGFGTINALQKNAKVIANDVCKEHLDILLQNCPNNLLKNLKCNLSRFPNELNIENATLDGILASEVFHFLKGEEIELGVKNIYNWLKYKGKVFISASTVYLKHKAELIPIYEQNKFNKLAWPGEIITNNYKNKHILLNNVPEFIHFLEEDILRNVFEKVGFEIEVCKTFTSRRILEEFRLDGRESLMLIASKK
ncbi:MAG: class I SAM-dependent methyltransferase [Bacteroidetes bacterium]|nr:class I SAM-dependent methyltransferase [Bacteroidota bacterium]